MRIALAVLTSLAFCAISLFPAGAEASESLPKGDALYAIWSEMGNHVSGTNFYTAVNQSHRLRRNRVKCSFLFSNQYPIGGWQVWYGTATVTRTDYYWTRAALSPGWSERCFNAPTRNPRV